MRLPAAGRLPDFLAHERSFTTTSFAEAREASRTSFAYSRSEIALAQLSLDEDVGFCLDDKRLQPTEKALDDLCQLLKIPTSFARAIPTDLLATIVGRLHQYHQQTVTLVHRGDVVVGVIDPQKWTKTRAQHHRPHYQPVAAGDVLHLLESSWSGLADAPHITLADGGFRVELLTAQEVIEPKVGDVTRMGMVVTGSETGGPLPQARGHLLRLVCSNGATVPDRFGLVRFSSDWRVSDARRLTAFAAALRTLSLDVGVLRETYARLIDAPMTDHAFYNLHRQVRYVYRHVPDGEEHADAALGVDREQRQQLIGQVRQRQAALRSTGRLALEPPRPTWLPTWAVFNSITAAAREEPCRRRVPLERLAGELLDGFAFAPESGG